ncbi:H-type small acid-soluble spore protein [Paenibacillus chartarius]|uniref:H-type small acid-soluble spore protein n=1 Tax=Paenibacillus chartarius TaxID=747481 RepID=A0ABV6DKT6_9BACL
MKAYRAQEILNADERIDVELNGVSVWIDSVDMGKETAKVHVEDNPADVKIVMVDELQEIQ